MIQITEKGRLNKGRIDFAWRIGVKLQPDVSKLMSIFEECLRQLVIDD
jgi:hypothetical protein